MKTKARTAFAEATRSEPGVPWVWDCGRSGGRRELGHTASWYHGLCGQRRGRSRSGRGLL